jgi:acyl-CoA reductase-like NAD-dependent aldehyde dehydrogenase
VLEALSRETGRTELECFATEYLPSVYTIKWLKQHGERILADRHPGTGFPSFFGLRSVTERRIPAGNVLIIGTWNYPFQISFRQILFALFAGNTVYFKPSPKAEVFGSLIKSIFSATPFDSRLKIIPSSHDSVDQLWDRLDHLVFTGSTKVGRLLSAKAGERFIPCTIEASGFDSVLIGRDDISSSHAEHLVWALTTRQGQTCVAPKILWVKASKTSSVVEQIASRIGSAAACNAPEFVSAARESGFSQHAQNILTASSLSILRNLFDMPSIEDKLPFAPLLLIVSYEDIRDVFDWANSPFGGLAFSTLGLSQTEQRRVNASINRSVIVHDEVVIHAGAPAISFGGRGISGMGYSGGAEHLLSMTRPSTIVRSSRFNRRVLPNRSQFDGSDRVSHRFLTFIKNRL